MSFIRKIFGPSNALVLAYDHLTDEDRDEFEAQLDETRQFYRFVKLSELARAVAEGRPQGLAAVCFLAARKSFALRALPFLRGQEIPVTVFLHPDSIGLNRLPAEEELQWFREHYPDAFPEGEYSVLKDMAWNEPASAEEWLRDARKRMGALPLDRMDPTSFYATWGKLVDIPPELFEAGLAVTSNPVDEERLAGAIAFIRTQLGGREVPVASNSRAPDGEAALRRAGIQGVLTADRGAVDRNTRTMQLPRWKFERESSILYK